MSHKYSYDPICETVAKYFLQNEPIKTPEHVQELAQLIQTTIEDFIRFTANDIDESNRSAEQGGGETQESPFHCPNTNRGLSLCEAKPHLKHGGGQFYSCGVINCPLTAKPTTHTGGRG